VLLTEGAAELRLLDRLLDGVPVPLGTVMNGGLGGSSSGDCILRLPVRKPVLECKCDEEEEEGKRSWYSNDLCEVSGMCWRKEKAKARKNGKRRFERS